MTEDLKILVAVREILGSALREMDTFPIGVRPDIKPDFLILDALNETTRAYCLIDRAIRQHENAKCDAV